MDSVEIVMARKLPDISVVICTFNRADSLGETLESLARADREGMEIEVVVVDNNSTDSTKEVIESYSGRLDIRYLFEPKQGHGKADPLNRALEAGGFGEIVAFLDDDMTVEEGWFRGVRSICARYPDHDLFSGRSYVIWPCEEIPGWAKDLHVLQWAMSVMESIHEDREIHRGYWPSGNHYWVRSRVFEDGRGFQNIWSEAHFTLGLLEDGYRGVYGPDAVVGHRIQPPLLDPDTLRKRAIVTGKSRANSCLPYPRSFPRAKLLRDHPLRFRTLVLANALRWWLKSKLAAAKGFNDKNFPEELTALLEMAYNLESFRIAGRVRHGWGRTGVEVSESAPGADPLMVGKEDS